MHQEFDGIKGVEGVTCYAGNLTVGVKGPSGAPVRKDRFFILGAGHEEIVNAQGKALAKGPRGLRHPMHPSFGPFNNVADDSNKAKVIRGNLIFPTRAENFNYQLAAQQLPGNGPAPGGGLLDTPPNNLPACRGDGERAQRFAGMRGDEIQWADIECPGELCAFAQARQARKVCGPLARLYFRVRWTDESVMPSVLLRYTTRGWRTMENILGLFTTLESIAKGLGLRPEQWSYFGLPFILTVTTKRQVHKGRAFPVVTATIEGDPAEFLMSAMHKRKALAGGPAALIGAGLTERESSPASVADAIAAVTPGVPARVANPERKAEAPQPPPEEQPIDAEIVDEDEDPRTPYNIVRDLQQELGLSRDDLDKARLAVCGSYTSDIPRDKVEAICNQLERRANA